MVRPPQLHIPIGSRLWPQGKILIPQAQGHTDSTILGRPLPWDFLSRHLSRHYNTKSKYPWDSSTIWRGQRETRPQAPLSLFLLAQKPWNYALPRFDTSYVPCWLRPPAATVFAALRASMTVRESHDGRRTYMYAISLLLLGFRRWNVPSTHKDTLTCMAPTTAKHTFPLQVLFPTPQHRLPRSLPNFHTSRGASVRSSGLYGLLTFGPSRWQD